MTTYIPKGTIQYPAYDNYRLSEFEPRIKEKIIEFTDRPKSYLSHEHIDDLLNLQAKHGEMYVYRYFGWRHAGYCTYQEAFGDKTKQDDHYLLTEGLAEALYTINQTLGQSVNNLSERMTQMEQIMLNICVVLQSHPSPSVRSK